MNHLIDPYDDDSATCVGALTSAKFGSIGDEIVALLEAADGAPLDDVIEILERVAELETARAGGFIGTDPDDDADDDDDSLPW